MKGRDFTSDRDLIQHASVWWLTFMICAMSALLANADCVPAGSGVIGWWPGDGNANNVFGTNNGTLQGGATASSAGMVNSAFSFDGTNGSVSIPNSPLLRPTNLTIEAWVKFASLDSAGSGGSPAGDQYIVFRQNTRSSDFEGFDLSKTRVGGSDVFRFLISSASAQTVELHSATTIGTGAWYHVAGVRGSNFVQIYVNGALERQTNISFPQDYGNFPLYFGTSGQAAWDHKLKGNLDEVTLYSRALSSNEIAAVYQAGAAGKCKGPSIISQPQSVTVFAGSNVTFTVGATGFGTLSYQWRSNGVPISDATNTSLTLSNVQPAFAADYTAIVTNLLGSATSAVATLTVGSPPAFAPPPSNQTNVLGSNVLFSSTVTGDQPLAFQWYFNGAQLTDDGRHSGSTNNNLSISGIVEADAGNYTLVASNVFGVRTSAVATLTVLVPASIVTQPTDQYILTNMSALFTVGAKGDSPLGFQWYLGSTPLSDGVRISGANTAALTIQNVQSSDLGGYLVIVSNAWGSATSSVVNLSFATPRYVNVNNGSPSAPYLAWASAATTIQNAIDAANIGDWIFVTNGTYQSGGAVVRTNQGNKVLNRVAAYKPLTIRSVNGPAATTIRGGSQVRCAYLTNGASLSGFTLTAGSLNFNNPGYNDWSGAGVVSEDATTAVVSNCVVQGNSGPYGGGANRVTLVNCLVAGNFAAGQGGGAYVCTLVNCTVTANNATYGGGMGWCTVTNSIVYGNAVNPPWDNTNQFNSTFAYSCTAPDPGGTGNTTNAPVFINAAGGNYRLQSNSPCLNAGVNLLPPGSLDLDGAPRMVDSVIDMGAYEYQHVPFILTQPTNQSVLIYSNVLFVVSALGDNLSYTWQKDGSNLVNDARTTGADTASLSISNLVAQDGGTYLVIITNTSGSVTSAVASLTLLGPPIISSQPVSRTVPAGTNVSFSVTASGLAALSYQWRFNGDELLAKTNSSLSLTNVQSPNAGDYDVVITNIYGGLTSSVATLVVVPVPPTITTQALSRVASVGQTVSFSVAAKGTEPLTCQWQFNGTDLLGATGFALTLQNANSSLNGNYRAAVTNSVGFAFSTNVTFVVSPVIVWGQTNNQQLLASATLPATATNIIAIAAAGSTDVGLPCLALRADGSIVAWGYSSRDLPPPTNAVDAVAISVGSSGGIANSMILRSDGSVVGWNGTTKPPSPPPGTNANFVAIAAGGSHQLALRDDGTVVAWGSNTSGVTNVPPNATNVIAIAAGTTHCLALRMDGTVVGWGLNTSGQATALTNASDIFKLAAGGNQSMGLRTDGTLVGRIVTNNTPVALLYAPPPADATNMIAMAAGSTHSLGLRADRTVTGWGQTNVGQINAPPYATNVLAIAAGGGDSLALVPDPFVPPIPPRIGRPPLSRVLIAGRDAVLNALPIGGLPLRCQWYKDGTPLLSQTNQWLAITNCQFTDAGNYQLVAINDFASATSAVAVVTLALPPLTLKSPVKNGQTFSLSFDSFLGADYITEFATAPFGPGWAVLEDWHGDGLPHTVTDTNLTSQPRFYRVLAIYPSTP